MKLSNAPRLPASVLSLKLLIAGTCCVAHPSEYQIKALFLLDFAQSVQWPAGAFPSKRAPLVIGVLGEDPFGPLLDAVVRSSSRIGTRSVVIERYHDIAEVHRCHILFIGRPQLPELPRILEALKEQSVLTVSDADDEEQSGVMIQLVTRSDRIRLRIDVGAAKASHLVISPRLLRPAKVIAGRSAPDVG